MFFAAPTADIISDMNDIRVTGFTNLDNTFNFLFIFFRIRPKPGTNERFYTVFMGYAGNQFITIYT